MSDKPAPATKKSWWSNPFVLIGGGAVVLYLMLKSGGGSSSGGTDAATSTAVGQALDDQTKAVNAALAAQNTQVAGQLSAENDMLQNALNTPAAPQDLSGNATIQSIQQQIAALAAQVKAKPTSGGSGITTDPNAPTYPNVDLSPNSALALQANSWAKGIGLPYEWGLAFIQAYGRLPKNIAELNIWRQHIGQINSNGTWTINGKTV